MKRSGLNTINAALFFVIGVGNAITILTDDKPLWWLSTHTGVLIGIALAFFLLKPKISPKISAILYVIVSLFSIIFAEHDSLTGSFFLCFAIYILENKKITIFALTATAIAVLAKAAFTPWSVPQTINFIAGYSYILAVYWVLIHPKQPKITSKELDYETLEIILKLYKGMNRAEISDSLSINPSTVTDKMKKARSKMGAKSDMELWEKLRQKGYISI